MNKRIQTSVGLTDRQKAGGARLNTDQTPAAERTSQTREEEILTQLSDIGPRCSAGSLA